MGCQHIPVEAAGIRPSLTLPRTYNKAWLNVAFFPELTAITCDGSSDTIIQHGYVYSSFQVPWKNLGSCTSLVPTPRTPPGEKRSGERSQISWAYSPKRWKTNEIARSLIIT